MNYEETEAFIDSSLWGEGSDDTKVLARMLLEIKENLRIANLLKVHELELISGKELEALGLTSLGLPTQ